VQIISLSFLCAAHPLYMTDSIHEQCRKAFAYCRWNTDTMEIEIGIHMKSRYSLSVVVVY
jgi:hypothetical protein